MPKRTKSKRKSLLAAEKALQDTLRKSGYIALKNGGVVSARPPMPERFQSDHGRKYPSLQPVSKTPGKRELPADAKQFLVANSHKQGMEYIPCSEWLKTLNKTSTLEDLNGN